MARLTAEQKTFIVQRLACFDTPSAVAEAVKEVFGLELTRQTIQVYDPTKIAGKTLAKKWRELFDATREQFLTDTTGIAVSHKAVRLQRLERMADKAEARGNYVLAAQLLEQIAKECGDMFTNLRRVAPTMPDGETPYQPARGLSESELDARIAELQQKVGGGK